MNLLSIKSAFNECRRFCKHSLVIARKNWITLWRAKLRLIAIVAMPVLMIYFLGFAVEKTTEHIPTGIAGADGNASRAFVKALQASKFFDVKKNVRTESELRRLIDDREIKVGFILPSDFDEKIARGEHVDVYILVDESETYTTAVAVQAASALVAMGSKRITLISVSKNAEAMGALASMLDRQAVTLEGTGEALRRASAALEENANLTNASAAQIKTSSALLSRMENEMTVPQAYQSSSLSAFVSQLKALSQQSRSLENAAERMHLLGERISSIVSLDPGMSGNTKEYVNAYIVASQSFANATVTYAGVNEKIISALAYNLEATGIQTVSTDALTHTIKTIRENSDKSALASQRSAMVDAKMASALKDVAENLEALSESNEKLSQDIMVLSARNPIDVVDPVGLVQIPMYGAGLRVLDFIVPGGLALGTMMGGIVLLGRSIAGEKEIGTLNRIFMTPVRTEAILFGNVFAFWFFDMFRVGLILAVCIFIFDITVKGSIFLAFLVLTLNSFVAMGIGMFISSHAETQEDYQQYVMLIMTPMMFLSPIFFPTDAMPEWMQGISQFLPLTHAVIALRDVMVRGFGFFEILPHLVYLVLFALLMFVLASITFKREVA